MKKRALTLFLALVMCLSLSIMAFAEETSRVVVSVESEEDIIEFMHSPNWDASKSYSFVIRSEMQARILCPDCGKGSYRGYTEHRDTHVHPRECPVPSFQSDMCYEYDVYTYSACEYCGYKTSKTFINRYWLVECSVELPDGWATYTARPGQSYLNGYDFHEDPVYMGLSDCLP